LKFQSILSLTEVQRFTYKNLLVLMACTKRGTK